MTDYTTLLVELNEDYRVAHINAGKLLTALLKEMTPDELKLFNYYECETSRNYFESVSNDGVFKLEDGGDMTVADINLLNLKEMIDIIKVTYPKYFQ